MTRSVGGDVVAVLYGKPDCHLCNEAEGMLTTICRDLGIGWRKVDIESDPALFERFRYRIPVIEIADGPTLDWPTTDGQVRRALLATSRA